MITAPEVAAYLESIRTEPDEVLAEMEAQADRDGVPVVPPVTGRLLSVLVAAIGAHTIVEVGTATGMSGLYMARAMPAGGRIISFDVDPDRQATAMGYFERAGVADKFDLRLQDAREGLTHIDVPVDLAFIDGVKQQYADYLVRVVPHLRVGGLIVADNTLMSGTVATGEPNGPWGAEHIAAMRAFNARLMSDPALDATVLPVGDGLTLAVRRA
jgi:predicted O-methyltransferase YrrM